MPAKKVKFKNVAPVVEESSGNVFADIGFGAEEAENLRTRADLMIHLTRLIEDRKLTQAAAAKALGVAQPRVSDLMRGKIQLFSTDTLIAMLGRLGMQVRISVKAA